MWVNPNVRVGYTKEAYEAVREWPGIWERVRSWGRGMLMGMLGMPWRDAKVGRRVKEWEGARVGNREVGVDCLVDEMQILAANGWKHV